MLIATVIDNYDLNERDCTAPSHLLGSVAAIDRANVFDQIFLRHYADLFHLSPGSVRGTKYAPRYTGGANRPG